MNKLFYCLAVIALLATAACSKTSDEFVVQGTTTQDRLNGVQVFIVPCNPKSMMFTDKNFEDSIGVDSVYIKDNKFEFRGKGEYLARITIDKHYRMGTQDLLIITEPGKTVQVLIDTISQGGGTPQNEALQQWKDLKMRHDAIAGPKVQQAFLLRQAGDTLAAQAISDSLKIFNQQFTDQVLDIARLLGSGTAYDLLNYRYNKN